MFGHCRLPLGEIGKENKITSFILFVISHKGEEKPGSPRELPMHQTRETIGIF